MSPPDRYTCEQVFSRLDDFLDRELTPEEMQLVQEHLEICDWCAGAYEFQAGVLRSLRRRMQRIAAPADLQAKVFAVLRKASEETKE